MPYQDKFGVFTPGDARGQLLKQLGLTLPPQLAERAEKEFFFDVSREEAALLEGDVLVVMDDNQSGSAGLADLERLDVAKRGGDIVVEPRLRAAMTYNTVLSAPYAVQRLAPQLSAALG